MVSEMKKIEPASPAISGASKTGRLINRSKETALGKAVIDMAKKMLTLPLSSGAINGVAHLLANEKKNNLTQAQKKTAPPVTVKTLPEDQETTAPLTVEIQSQQANLQITPNK